MALLALWHVEDADPAHDLTYSFREPYAGNVTVRVEDSGGGQPWVPDYETDAVRGKIFAVTVTPEADWIYPVRIKIRSNP